MVNKNFCFFFFFLPGSQIEIKGWGRNNFFFFLVQFKFRSTGNFGKKENTKSEGVNGCVFEQEGVFF